MTALFTEPSEGGGEKNTLVTLGTSIVLLRIKTLGRLYVREFREGE